MLTSPLSRSRIALAVSVSALAAVSIALVAATACDRGQSANDSPSASPQPAAAAAVSPSPDATATVVPTPNMATAEGLTPQEVIDVVESLQPVEVRPCTSADLNAAVTSSNGLVGGQIVAYLGFGNKSDTACSLEGVPGLELLDAEGRRLAVDVFSLCETQGSDPCQPRQTVIVGPDTGDLERHRARLGQVAVELYWPTHTDAPPCSPSPGEAVTIRVYLPSGESVDAAVAPEFDWISPCRRLGVGWFTSVPSDR